MTLDTFFKKFDQFADAPNAVAKMRELALTLAIQGKFVDQNPEDEPAQILLKRIDDERERMVKTKKIRHRDLLGPIPDGDIPFSIPASWQWRYLADICFLITDGAHHTPHYQESGVPFLSVKDVSSGTIKFSDTRFISHEAHRELCKRCEPERGDILLTKVGTTGIAVTIDEDREFSIFVSLALLKFSQSNLDGNFLRYLINSPFVKKQSADNTQGIGNKNLVLRLINSFTIPLPPLAEQKRIVAKVDELMALCDRLEAQQQERDEQASALARASLARFAEAPTPANLNLLFHKSYSILPGDLRKAVVALAVRGKLLPQNLKDEPADVLIENIAKKRVSKKAKDYAPVGAYEIPYEIPHLWSWVRLGNMALSSDSGWSPQCGSEQRSGNAWGVLKVSAVSWGVFKPDENKALPKGVDARPDCEVRPGDFLLSRANTEELVARSVVVEQTPPRLMMSDKIVRFTFPEEIDKAFINLANLSMPSREYYARNASGTSSSMKNIGREVMCNLPIALPPLAEQRRIVAKVDQLMALVDQLETQLAASRATAKNLLEALVAELTSNDTVSSANGASHPSLGQRPRKSPAKATKG